MLMFPGSYAEWVLDEAWNALEEDIRSRYSRLPLTQVSMQRIIQTLSSLLRAAKNDLLDKIYSKYL